MLGLFVTEVGLPMTSYNFMQIFPSKRIYIRVYILNFTLLQRQANLLQEGEKVKVKLSGDGARMSRVSNFILMSMSILQSKDDLLSSKGV